MTTRYFIHGRRSKTDNTTIRCYEGTENTEISLKRNLCALCASVATFMPAQKSNCALILMNRAWRIRFGTCQTAVPPGTGV